MENRERESFFLIITSAVSGRPLSAQERARYAPDMLPAMSALARQHDLTHLLALGLKNNGLCGEQGKELDNEMFRAAFRCEQLEHELKKICGTLEKARIPFIPLKGSVLRRYYPEPWMRTSCDIDVFVREVDLDRAMEALSENLSYRIGEISDHDVQIYTPNGQHIELHRNLIEDHRINQVFETYKPDVVYHAAAHKHVPLMEDSPCEAIKNNAIGTYKTAYAAMVNGCKRFVLISTDKAVNPTNIMGASKRLCEMIIQSFSRKIRDGKADELPPLHVHSSDESGSMREIMKSAKNAKTEFVAVCFGNVLGSNGSVVPRFKEQIAKGGPVTVTHPDVIRYFMTIPEAAALVLQAGTYAKGGEIFVLDMGSPVKIDTLARNLIKLSGLRPDVDIKIEYTGLRPGEKLYEEKLMSEEGLRTTPNQLIHIGSPIRFDTDVFLRQLQMLMKVAYAGNEEELRAQVERVVTTYQPAGRHGSEHKGEAFEKQMELVEHKEAQREGTPRRHEGRRGNYGARSLPRHEAAVKE